MTTTYQATATNTFLKNVLRLDAVATGAIGVLFLAGSGLLQDHLGLPPALSRTAGAFLVAWAIGVWLVSMRTRSSAVRTVVAGNLLWVVASVVYTLADDRLTALGVGFGLLQAAAVLGFAALQGAGLRRASQDQQ